MDNNETLTPVETSEIALVETTPTYTTGQVVVGTLVQVAATAAASIIVVGVTMAASAGAERFSTWRGERKARKAEKLAEAQETPKED